MARSQSSPPSKISDDRSTATRGLARSERSDAHANHHLWRNGRLWWVAFTVHLPGWQKERVRISLGTDDVAEARRRRDEILKHYPAARGCQLSLRMTPPRSRSQPGRPPDGWRPFAA
jgi:hypothetical protein